MFHSFRHTFRTELRNHAVISERVDLLCGWKGDKGLNAHYGTISMKELYKTLSENIVYDGLDLPPTELIIPISLPPIKRKEAAIIEIIKTNIAKTLLHI